MSTSTQSRTFTRPTTAQAQRPFFVHVPMIDENGKIGKMIKDLAGLRQTVGGGVFINYKRQEDSDKIVEWSVANPHVLPVRPHGAGWYVWAFNKANVLHAKELLLEEERKLLSIKQRQPRTDHRFSKVQEVKLVVQEVKVGQKEANEFPALVASSQPVKLASIWANKPVFVEKPVEKQETPVVIETFVPIPQTPKRKEKLVDYFEDEIVDDWETMYD